MRVDQADPQPARLQYLKQRNPVDPGRFHRHRRHRLDSAALKPIGCGEKIFGKRGEPQHRLTISVPGHGDINLRRSDIDSRGVGLEQRCRREPTRLRLLLLFQHGTPPVPCQTARVVPLGAISQTGSACPRRAATVTTYLSTKRRDHAILRAPHGGANANFGLLAARQGSSRINHSQRGPSLLEPQYAVHPLFLPTCRFGSGGERLLQHKS